MPPVHTNTAHAASSDHLMENVTKFPHEPSEPGNILRTLTTEEPLDHELYWAIGAHEISAVAIVLVTVVMVVLIAALYFMYKYCRCCQKCRKESSETADPVDSKISDPNNIQSILKTREDWDKRAAESELKPSASTGSISSFLDGNI